jgi:hypothetical protein
LPSNFLALFLRAVFLEDLLGCTIYLVTEKALRPELKAFMEKELVNV